MSKIDLRRRRRAVASSVIWLALAFLLAIGTGDTARSADGCDYLIAALKKLSDEVVNQKDEPKNRFAGCAVVGEVLGILKSSREIAATCYATGVQKDEIVRNFDQAANEMTAKIDAACH